MSNIKFSWGFADSKNPNGIPAQWNWHTGFIKIVTNVHQLHLAFVNLVRKKHKRDDVRVRLHFKIGKINACFPGTFIRPSLEDLNRFIECTPEWVEVDVIDLITENGLSLIVSTKLGNDPWSWEAPFLEDQVPKVGIIYDVLDHHGNWYEAILVSFVSTSCHFHYINWSKKWDEHVSLLELETRVLQRGSHTTGYHFQPPVSSDYQYLYPPYPKPVIANNQDINLSSCNQLVSNIMDRVTPSITSKIKTDSQDLLSCFVKDKLCRNVTFVLKGGVTLNAHKAVLSIRSPVFRKMLASNMVEAKTGRIELLDVDPAAMDIFINSLYHTEIPDNIDPDVWEAVFSLYDKYQVYYPIPKLLAKIEDMDFDEIFPRLFNMFRTNPFLESYFKEHKTEIILAILKIQPKNRTQAMQKYLMEGHLS